MAKTVTIIPMDRKDRISYSNAYISDRSKCGEFLTIKYPRGTKVCTIMLSLRSVSFVKEEEQIPGAV